MTGQINMHSSASKIIIKVKQNKIHLIGDLTTLNGLIITTIIEYNSGKGKKRGNEIHISFFARNEISINKK